MLSVSSRIWTRVAVSISSDDNHYTTGTSTEYIYIYIYLYIYIYHHHHHVVPQARISLALSRHFSLSFIASGRSSGLHPVSSHSWCMYFRVGRPASAWPYAGVQRSTSLMSSSLLLQQCPACLVRLTWIVFVMGGRWPYRWCLVWCWYAYYCCILKLWRCKNWLESFPSGGRSFNPSLTILNNNKES